MTTIFGHIGELAVTVRALTEKGAKKKMEKKIKKYYFDPYGSAFVFNMSKGKKVSRTTIYIEDEINTFDGVYEMVFCNIDR